MRDFEHLVEALPNAIIQVDGEGRIIMANSRAEALFGYRREELLGQSLEMLVPQRFRGAHREHRAGFFVAPSTRPMGAGRDLYGLRRDGSEIPIEIGLSPTHTQDGPRVMASIIDITERLRSERQLRNSLREKEVLLREIHHRVKNNLAIIGSLLYLRSTTTKDEETLRILRDCQDRVRSMALVHERLYLSEDMASVDFMEYTRELSQELLANSQLDPGSIELRTNLESVEMVIDRAIPCGLVLTELVSNAIKHAFPPGASGAIEVSLRRLDAGGWVLTVADDGVGLPEDLLNHEGRSTESLGLRLVRSLAGQMDARFELRSRRPGTEARLTLEN